MDQQLLFLINRQWTGPALDWLMVIMSSFALWGLPLLLLFAAVVFKGRFRGRAMLATLALGILLSDGIIVNALKKTVERPRPPQVLKGIRQIDLAKARPRFLALTRPLKVTLSDPAPNQSKGRSFPSAHTSNNFCAAVVVAAFYRRRGWLMFIVAALVGYSRVYVGSHWPSDVLASAFLGMGIGLIALFLAKRIWGILGARLCPTIFSNHPNLLGPHNL